MTDANEVKPDTRAKLNQLDEQVEYLDARVDTLDLPSRIEFCRLLRIAESSVEFIAMRANELVEAKDELKKKNKNVDKAVFWTFGMASLFLIANNFYTLPVAISTPLWLLMAAWYGKISFDKWNCEQKVEKIKAVYSQHRFSFFSAGFSRHLLDSIAHFTQKGHPDGVFNDEHMLTDKQIELAIKDACFKLCQGVHDYGYGQTPPFKN
ncbi:hypothetical protein MCERE10_02548 [Burkholderiaceae bacterium]